MQLKNKKTLIGMIKNRHANVHVATAITVAVLICSRTTQVIRYVNVLKFSFFRLMLKDNTIHEWVWLGKTESSHKCSIFAKRQRIKFVETTVVARYNATKYAFAIIVPSSGMRKNLKLSTVSLHQRHELAYHSSSTRWPIFLNKSLYTCTSQSVYSD